MLRIFSLFFVILIIFPINLKSEYIFDLRGVWKGINKSYSLEKGYRSWEKEINIFEQNDRLFKGNFKYIDGETNFLGVIRQNNKICYWVSPESKGYIHGEIININTIEVCYMEAHKGAAIGCSILKRIKK